MIIVLNVVIFLGFVVLWVLPPFLKQGRKEMVSLKWHLFSLLAGAIVACGGGIGLQLLFDNAVKASGLTGVPFHLVNAFISAALIEEVLKFVCGRVVLHFSKAIRKIDYIFIIGAAGVGFELTETFLGMNGETGIVGGIIRGVICLHLFLQLFMGAHLYECHMAKKAGEKGRMVREFILAFIVPFFVHGFNDFALFILQESVSGVTESVDTAQTAAAALSGSAIAGIVLFILAMAVDIVFIIFTLRTVYKESKNSRLAEAAE